MERRLLLGVRREVDSSMPAARRAFENVIAPARFVSSETLRYNTWPVLAQVDDALFGRYRKEEATCSAELDLRVTQPQPGSRDAASERRPLRQRIVSCCCDRCAAPF